MHVRLLRLEVSQLTHLKPRYRCFEGESSDSPLWNTGFMSRELSAYHRQVAATNRAAILDAATDLFLEFGYDRTSLARVAERAGVSKATLFKQFPTKAELFEATVLAAGDAPDGVPVDPPSGDFRAGLVTLGLAYVELLCRPRMADLIRAVIAESPRFPELRERTFDFGTLPVLASLRRYFRAETAAGTADVDDLDLAATQFLGMIATVVFWPRLVHGNWSLSDEETRTVVDEAAQTIVARYAAPVSR
ncbi:TetR/AcrR family transcriptional regulator [Agromyces sp. SYSU K20354]|uniref:TetR/AcrR family transcriptional regulator n=1 Tax=Agromyces cavernae TaxID=2898659 RepID=UPI001E3E3C85|nr:TetR/AcrR family transcriptional regulator [Agromyces cavernae]MCD2443356.1 TetR/AcrR family transcriptional regulator [Agromyces cavernae]